MSMMIRQSGQLVREVTIRQALEWAFAVEHARLDFDETGAHEFTRPGLDSTMRVYEWGLLGCRVDGGGSSDPHPDAQIIAAAVQALPVEYGGKAMAAQVAELARTRSEPDWKIPERRGVVPCGWDLTDDGEWVAVVRSLDPVDYLDRRWRKIRTYRPALCPISYSGSAAVIAKSRRAYLAWYGALLYLAFELGSARGLTSLRLADGLPALSPWK